jgi:hypothetical protein
MPIPDSLTALFRQVVSGLEPSARIWHFSRTTAYRMVKNRMAAAGVAGAMACPKGCVTASPWPCIAQNIPLTTVQK